MSIDINMSIDIDDTNPSDWVFKGQGNANVVFSYVGQRVDLINKVLRLRKPKQATNDSPELQQLNQDVWKIIDEPLESQAMEEAYIDLFIAPMLGRQYLPPKIQATASSTLIHPLLKNHTAPPAPPTAFDEPLQTNSHAEHAALMPDVTFFPYNSSNTSDTSTEGPCICIEIKPKCGFTTTCLSVHPNNAPLKHTSPRFHLHQLLKAKQGKVEAASRYDPQDLFSGEEERMGVALQALFDSPQNNLVVFRDGQPVAAAVSTRGTQHEEVKNEPGIRSNDSSSLISSAIEGLIEGGTEVEQRQGLAALLCKIFREEDVLNSLLLAQQMCPYDIEGIFALYCSLLDLPEPDQPPTPPQHAILSSPSGCTSPITATSTTRHGYNAWQGMQKYLQGLSRSRSEACEVLLSYVISTTAKDCSLMITLQRLSDSDNENPETSNNESSTPTKVERRERKQEDVDVPGVLYCKDAGGWFQYRIVFVDLDMKPLSKIPRHYELDREIVEAAREHYSSQQQLCDIADL